MALTLARLPLSAKVLDVHSKEGNRGAGFTAPHTCSRDIDINLHGVLYLFS
jgi:hypothetical protein